MKAFALVCMTAMAAAASAAVVPGAPPAAPLIPGAGAALNPMSPGFGASFAGPFSMYMMPPAGIPGVPGGVPGVVGGLSLSQLAVGGAPGVVGGPLVAPSMPPAVADLVKKKVALGTGAAAPAS
ncbi:annexin A7-like [Macrobrachium rosenbergii]|uniref:annexin A7-like n=1 Tax=Macrobrachium rosenbergii TaxID=79674 RepID=UPI0034D5AB0E